MAKRIFGLQKVEIAPIAVDGGLGTDWMIIGETVVGSASITTEDNQTTDIFEEESDSPLESIVTQAGKMSFNWSTYRLDPVVLVRLLGGVHTPASEGVPEKWDAPDSFPDIEASVRWTDKKGVVVQSPRVKISSKMGVSFTKDALGQLDMVGTILKPTKANTARMSIIFDTE